MAVEQTVLKRRSEESTAGRGAVVEVGAAARLVGLTKAGPAGGKAGLRRALGKGVVSGPPRAGQMVRYTRPVDPRPA